MKKSFNLIIAGLTCAAIGVVNNSELMMSTSVIILTIDCGVDRIVAALHYKHIGQQADE